MSCARDESAVGTRAWTKAPASSSKESRISGIGGGSDGSGSDGVIETSSVDKRATSPLSNKKRSTSRVTSLANERLRPRKMVNLTSVATDGDADSNAYSFARSVEPNLARRGQSSSTAIVPIAIRPPASSSNDASSGIDGAKMGIAA